MALTTINAVKIHLGISSTDTSEDTFLSQLLNAAESAFKKLVDREIEVASYTEFYSGHNKSILLLNEYPVVSVTSVYLDGNGAWGQSDNAFPAESLLVPGVDYALVKDGRNGATASGRLMRLTGVWPGTFRWKRGLLVPMPGPGIGNIKVVSTCGYPQIPPEIQLALWQVCAELRAMRLTGRFPTSESFDGYSVSYGEQKATELLQLPGSRSQVVARYRRISPRLEVQGV